MRQKGSVLARLKYEIGGLNLQYCYLGTWVKTQKETAKHLSQLILIDFHRESNLIYYGVPWVSYKPACVLWSCKLKFWPFWTLSKSLKFFFSVSFLSDVIYIQNHLGDNAFFDGLRDFSRAILVGHFLQSHQNQGKEVACQLLVKYTSLGDFNSEFLTLFILVRCHTPCFLSPTPVFSLLGFHPN